MYEWISVLKVINFSKKLIFDKYFEAKIVSLDIDRYIVIAR